MKITSKFFLLFLWGVFMVTLPIEAQRRVVDALDRLPVSTASIFDAAGNVISKTHLFCNSLSKNRIYKTELNVPVNAVRFSIEGFN